MIKQIGEREYNQVVLWWEKHGWPAIPAMMLPETGYITYVEDKPVVAGFLYLPRSGTIGWLEFIVANPDSTREQRDQAFSVFFKHITEEAKGLGLHSLFTSTDSKSLIQRYLDNGFVVTEGATTQLLKALY